MVISRGIDQNPVSASPNANRFCMACHILGPCLSAALAAAIACCRSHRLITRHRRLFLHRGRQLYGVITATITTNAACRYTLLATQIARRGCVAQQWPRQTRWDFERAMAWPHSFALARSIRTPRFHPRSVHGNRPLHRLLAKTSTFIVVALPSGATTIHGDT